MNEFVLNLIRSAQVMPTYPITVNTSLNYHMPNPYLINNFNIPTPPNNINNVVFEQFLCHLREVAQNSQKVSELQSVLKEKWSIEEDSKLRGLVKQYGTKNWKKIAEYFPKRSHKECFYRWNKKLKHMLENNTWTSHEDSFIIKWVKAKGTSNWTRCAKYLKAKTPSECRNRWEQTLSNIIDQESNGSFLWNKKNEYLLLQNVTKYGTTWSRLIEFFPSCEENEIKNKFYSLMRKVANNLIRKKNIEININVLKPNELLNFLPHALNEYTNEMEKINSLSQSFKPNLINSTQEKIETKHNLLDCKIKQKKINICNDCRIKLRGEMKKYVYKEMIKTQIQNSNSTETQSFKFLDNVEKLMSASSKISTMKEILQGFANSAN